MFSSAGAAATLVEIDGMAKTSRVDRERLPMSEASKTTTTTKEINNRVNVEGGWVNAMTPLYKTVGRAASATNTQSEESNDVWSVLLLMMMINNN